MKSIQVICLSLSLAVSDISGFAIARTSKLTERQLQFWEDVEDGLDEIEQFWAKKGENIDRIRAFGRR